MGWLLAFIHKFVPIEKDMRSSLSLCLPSLLLLREGITSSVPSAKQKVGPHQWEYMTAVMTAEA